MEVSLFLIFLVVAYILYGQHKGEGKRIIREEQFKNISNLPPDLRRLINRNKKMEAIKEYRRLYGAGLKEAQDVICRHLPPTYEKTS